MFDCDIIILHQGKVFAFFYYYIISQLILKPILYVRPNSLIINNQITEQVTKYFIKTTNMKAKFLVF